MEENTSSPVKARRSSAPSCLPENCCFFCDSIDDPINLRAASTLEVDRNIRECAVLLKDNKLIAKLSARDLMCTMQSA